MLPVLVGQCYTGVAKMGAIRAIPEVFGIEIVYAVSQSDLLWETTEMPNALHLRGGVG